MEIIKHLGGKLTAEEKETHLVYDFINRVWIMDSTVPKHFNRAMKQQWKPLKKYVYSDGAVFGMMLEAPGRAITIRNVEPKQMSKKQLENLSVDDEDEE